MRKLLVAVVVLLVLLAVADRVAVRVADRVLADQLTGELGTRPAVDVRGVPFLTQVLAGRYDDVRLRAGSVRRAGVTVSGVSAQLSGVEVPLSAAVRGKVTSVPVQRLGVTGLLDYAQLERLAGGRLTLVPAGDGAVTVSGALRVAGRQVAASARATVRLTDGALLLAAQDVRVAGVAPPRAVADALDDQLSLRLPLPTLPYDVALESVVAGPDGVRLSGTGRAVALRR